MSVAEVLKRKPSHRFKNTNCPFSLVLKFKQNPNVEDVPCLLDVEWTHNHPVNSLQSLSFKDISEETKGQILLLFKLGFTPGLAYKEFLLKTKESCQTDLELHQVWMALTTLGVETFAWINFRGSRNLLFFAWINFRGSRA